MKDEDIIGQEFEGIKFEAVTNLKYSNTYHKPYLGRTGTVININKIFPHLCQVEFNMGIGKKGESYYPVELVKQQIEDRVPIDLDELFKNIKSL